jgi:hypothetical protein
MSFTPIAARETHNGRRPEARLVIGLLNDASGSHRICDRQSECPGLLSKARPSSSLLVAFETKRNAGLKNCRE